MTPVKKTCSGCGAEQPLERFWRNKAGRFGRYSICIDCPSGVIERHQRATRDTVLKSKYNITIDQYEELVAAQLGRCDICGSPPGKRGLAVDHNHKTKEVRGLLCGECNMGLGRFKDNPILLSRATTYLVSRGHDDTAPYDPVPAWLLKMVREAPTVDEFCRANCPDCGGH